MIGMIGLRDAAWPNLAYRKNRTDAENVECLSQEQSLSAWYVSVEHGSFR